MSVLRAFVDYPPGPLETTENLEQLRLLENGHPIHVVLTKHASIGVDRPADLAKVKSLLSHVKNTDQSDGKDLVK
jgi:3-deoxy-manno-octulosonate cytidylyltransferase (CMP-KDO synthetase)